MAIDNPTQVNNPGRTTVRTFVQSAIGLLVGLGLVAPQILAALIDGANKAGFEEIAVALGAGSGTVLAIAGLIARVMAIPGVEQFLQKTSGFRWLAARKVPLDNGPGDLGFDAGLSGYMAHDLTTDDRLDDDPAAQHAESDVAVIVEDDADIPDYEDGAPGTGDDEPKHLKGN